VFTIDGSTAHSLGLIRLGVFDMAIGHFFACALRLPPRNRRTAALVADIQNGAQPVRSPSSHLKPWTRKPSWSCQILIRKSCGHIDAGDAGFPAGRHGSGTNAARRNDFVVFVGGLGDGTLNPVEPG